MFKCQYKTCSPERVSGIFPVNFHTKWWHVHVPLGCAGSYVCSPMCALLCVLSYVCSHMSAFICVLPYVCSDMSLPPLVSSPFAPPTLFGLFSIPRGWSAGKRNETTFPTQKSFFFHISVWQPWSLWVVAQRHGHAIMSEMPPPKRKKRKDRSESD